MSNQMGSFRVQQWIKLCCRQKTLGTEAAELAAASLLQNTREHTTEKNSQPEPPLPLEKLIRDGGHHKIARFVNIAVQQTVLYTGHVA